MFFQALSRILIHLLHPIRDRHTECVQPIIVDDAVLVLGDAGHLDEQLVIRILGLGIFQDDGSVHHDTVLVQNRLRDILLPLLLYPLAVPLIIGGVQATSLIYTGDIASARNWMRVLAAFDLLFIVVSYFLFGRVLRAIEG